MTTARKQFISLADVPYYQCISCCVRHDYLCGEDKNIGKNLVTYEVGWKMNYLA
jgi:hypothetical protein